MLHLSRSSIRFSLCFLALAATGVQAKTSLSLSNQTALRFDLAMTQEGAELKPKHWKATAPAVEAGQTVTFGQFSRGSGIKRGKRYLFRTYATAIQQNETCQIELLQYLRGTVFHSHLWQGARSGVYQDPGFRDDRQLGRSFATCFGRHIGITYQAQSTGGDDNIKYGFEDLGPANQEEAEQSLNLMTFNIYMRPTELFKNSQKKRADAIAEILTEYHRQKPIDALILVEVFDDDIRNHLVSKLKPILPYASNILGSDRVFEQDGGVIVLTRGPIVFERQVLFGSLCNKVFEDCLSDKGGLYVSTLINGKPYNLVATHLQAGGTSKDRSVRRQQLDLLQQRSRTIFSALDGTRAPTFLGGDINIALGSDEYTSVERSDWYLPMLETMPVPPEEKATARPAINFADVINSFDPRFNKLATDGGTEWLDYFLYDVTSSDAVVEGSMKVELLRGANELELSDHFPVSTRFIVR